MNIKNTYFETLSIPTKLYLFDNDLLKLIDKNYFFILINYSILEQENF